jgi:hypothetical protein
LFDKPFFIVKAAGCRSFPENGAFVVAACVNIFRHAAGALNER